VHPPEDWGRPFTSLSVLLPVMNETTALEATVATLAGQLGSDLGEIIVVVSPRTTEASREVIAHLDAGPAVKIQVHEQHLPYLGGALREGFALASGSHVVMMASDLETDPSSVKDLVAASRANPGAVVTATRWKGTPRGRFDGYNPVKLLLNAAFQRVFATLYRTQLSDMTYGFRLFPTALVRSVRWDELRHPFLLETIVKPLRLGVPVIEVPTHWRARSEGESSNTFLTNVTYVRTGLRVRFARRSSLLDTLGVSS
jgi:glycosyltransferase involved in cell wall biosynthesis